MATATRDKIVGSWMGDLYLPAYRVSEAAKYVGVHPNTVSAWHYRGDPVLPGRTRGRPLSYLELIEVAFVAFFRRLDIDMSFIRKARESRISDKHDEPHRDGMSPNGWNHSVRNVEGKYPFASMSFRRDAIRILERERKSNSSLKDVTQFTNPGHWDRVDLGHAKENCQFADFDYAHGIVISWHPAGRDSQVMIDPRIAFGDPAVSGLSTWVILGRYSAGETIPEIMDDFEISETAVRDALAFEGIRVA